MQEQAEREARRRAKQQPTAASAAASRRRDELGDDLDPPTPEPGLPAAQTERGRAAGGRVQHPGRSSADSAWLDERDAQLPAQPDPRVRLVTASGKTIASTNESNAERAAAALEPRHGPLTIVPA